MPADYIYDTLEAGLDGVHCMVAQSCRDPVATRSFRRLHDNVCCCVDRQQAAARLQPQLCQETDLQETAT